jgi:hypothetical protein
MMLIALAFRYAGCDSSRVDLEGDHVDRTLGGSGLGKEILGAEGFQALEHR